MEKLVSVIIPVYNVEAYLGECVLSVCEQTYSNIEIILVDDGSTDTSGIICDEWKKRDSRIQVIHKMNGGLSSARNAGLDIARGEYIYFCDSDDYIDINLLSETIPYMDMGYEMVVFEYNEIYDTGEIRPHAYHKNGSYVLDDTYKKVEFFTNILLKSMIGWGAWSRIYKRDIIEKYELRFKDNRIIFAEDLYFCLCYCGHITKVLSLNSLLYYYRQRQNSIMDENSTKLNIGRMNECGKEVRKHLLNFEECRCLTNIFPVIHFMILDNVVSKYQKNNNIKLKQLRYDIREDLMDYPFFEEQMKELKNHRNILYNIYSRRKVEEILNNVTYILNGKFFSTQIRHLFISGAAVLINIKRKVNGKFK